MATVTTGQAKLTAVSNLLDTLATNLTSSSLDEKECLQALEELKIYGRDPTNADPIFTQNGISVLLKYAFDVPNQETSRGALRVLANAMVLKPITRQMFIDEGYPTKACSRFNTQSWDDEFLIARLLFLSTYGSTVHLPNLIKTHNLATSVVSNLERHARLVSTNSNAGADPMESMALSETLRLLFNVTHFCKEDSDAFCPAIPHIAKLLWKQEISPVKPLDPPFGLLVNSLVNLRFSGEKSKLALFPKDSPNKVGSTLIDLLEKAIPEYEGNDLDANVTPLISVVSKLYESAPESCRKHLRERLLPTAEDRQLILGRGTTLSAMLLKNTTNPMAPAMKQAVWHLFFDLSDQDPTKFVEHVGYGFASGFLFQNNIPIPVSATETAGSTDSIGGQRPINPITGQFLDNEQHPDLPPMTDEEKEQEAERLFVLFERLRKTGIVNVPNPVELAAREGRLREAKEDEVEELD